MKKLLFLLLIAALNVVGAEVTGTWKASAEGPQGQMERTFTFKADGSKLTGETVSQMMGKSTIDNGKVDGDNLSFEIKVKFQDQEMVIQYKGSVKGDTIKMTAELPGGGNGIEWNGKRQ
jgi:hypothetical protein